MSRAVSVPQSPLICPRCERRVDRLLTPPFPIRALRLLDADTEPLLCTACLLDLEKEWVEERAGVRPVR
jgi:hypothetical protein